MADFKALPPIPDKRYFTISETGRLCDIKPHVLRYWEQEFPQLTPNKRSGNRRYYQHEDVQLVRKIRQLLYRDGFTIQGAKKYLASSEAKQEFKQQRHSDETQRFLKEAITELNQISLLLKN